MGTGRTYAVRFWSDMGHENAAFRDLSNTPVKNVPNEVQSYFFKHIVPKAIKEVFQDGFHFLKRLPGVPQNATYTGSLFGEPIFFDVQWQC